MRILKETNPYEKQEWLNIWKNWKGKEVFAHPDYIKLFTDENSYASCIYYTVNDSILIYPFIVREIPYIDTKKESSKKIYDIVSPYGYSGVYVIGNKVSETEYNIFFNYTTKWAEDNNIVSEFIRFSLNSQVIKFYSGEAVYNNNNIIIDLTLSKEERWNRYKQKVRKNVKKAISGNLKIIIDENGFYLNDFLNIYYKTMVRRGASNNYLFPKSFFEIINSKLVGNYVYFHAFYEEKIISTELVLVSDDNIYSFLGGTLSETFDLRPNDLLKHEIINWGIDNDKKQFILGGGYEPNDGIFNYKQSFEPENCTPFYVGKRIFNKKLYDILVDNIIKLDSNFDISSNYFPLYRAPINSIQNHK